MQKKLASSRPPKLPSLSMLLSYAILVFWALVVLFPFYWLVITTFKLPIDVSSGPKYIPFLEFQPSLNAWEEMRAFIPRPYINTLIVAVVSSILTLMIGSFAAYALIRFEYRPKLILVAVFLGCVALCGILIIAVGLPWPVSVLAAAALFFLIAVTAGRRFEGSMSNNDIAFWLISQRMLPPVAVILPSFNNSACSTLARD